MPDSPSNTRPRLVADTTSSVRKEQGAALSLAGTNDLFVARRDGE